MSVVDLSNLMEVIGDDRELEHEMFQEYIDSSQELLESLENCCANEKRKELWRQTAHALKGISFNLGANELAELSKNAEFSFNENQEIKKEILAKVKDEHQRVILFLNEKLAS